MNRTSAANEAVKTWPEYQNRKMCDYDLALALDPDKKQMTGKLDFTYVNTEDTPMGELHFLLYANSHAKQQYGIFEDQDMDKAYPNGFSPGSIDVTSVTSDDGKVDYLVTGDQRQVLRVHLPGSVDVGQTIKLSIEYTVTIPNCYGRFGYGDDTMSLVNCNPILAVYDAGKWYDYPYYDIGDPFYSETANYEATITAPEEYTIASTGVLTETQDGNEKVWTVDAPGRRDFGFVASNKFDVMQTVTDGVLVRSYYVKGSKSRGREALDTGAQAIALYDKSFGQYPYAEYSVVEADFFIGGMEYPGMVLIDNSMYSAFSDPMEFDLVVSHETGHQWWYSVIGDNEVMDPWLDEGLTEFTTQLFFEKNRNQSFNDFYRQYIDYMKGMRKGQDGEYAVTSPVFTFRDNMTYSVWIYDRTAAVMQDLRKKIGDAEFFAALQEYYKDNRLGITTRNELEKAFEDASGTDLTQWFEQEFNSSGN
jgi:hypothetical protein